MALPLMVLALGGGMIQGCTTSPGALRMVCGLCEERDRFVRLQAYPSHTFEDTQRRFSHPFNLSPKDWKSILVGIHIQPRLKPFIFGSVEVKETPLFTFDEVEYLSQTLNKAFSMSQPEDIVVFALTNPGPPNVTELTTGGWYVEGTTLHLLLANYRAAVSMSNIREVLDRDPLFTVVGSTLYDFVPGEYAKKSSKTRSFLSVLKSESHHLEIDYLGMLGITKLRPVNPSTSNEQGTSLPSLEERLQKLKELKQKGLITQHDFDQKKKELLDRF